MTVIEGRCVDLLCDRCARLATGRIDETGDELRERLTVRGWVFFDAKDLCTSCAVKAGLH